MAEQISQLIEKTHVIVMCEILIKNVMKEKGKLTAIINVFWHRDLALWTVLCYINCSIA